jgi:hypothetical protein
MDHAEEQKKKKDNTFLTGTNARSKSKGFHISQFIPISHTDVHKFIEEISEENLQLINFTNQELEAKDAMSNANNT